MAKQTSAEYWNKRATTRLTKAELAIDPHAKAVERIYNSAHASVTDDINQIYHTYAKGQGIDVDKLLEKLSIEDTHKFWLKMKKEGNLGYIQSNYASRITRLEQIKGDLYSKVRSIADGETDAQTKAHTATINEAYNRNVFDTSKGLDTNIAFGGLNQQVFDTMLNSPWLGANYSNRIWGNTNKLANSVKDLLSGSLLTGQSPLRLSQQIADQFNVGKYVADRLIRTETNHFQNEADAQSSQDMGLEKYMYLATLDKRTSLTCQLHDFHTYLYKDRMVGDNFPPLHPNCRSSTRAFIGYNYEPETRIARDENGKNVQVKNMSYKSWYDLNGVKNWGATTPPVPIPTPTTAKTSTKATAPGSTKVHPDHALSKFTKGEPMTPEEASRGTNPNYHTYERKWLTNCQRTVPTYEMRRRGYDVTAKPRDNQSWAIGTTATIPHVWGETGYDFRSGRRKLTRPDGTSYEVRQRTVKSEVTKHLLTYPVGARVQIVFDHVGRQTGHTMLMESVPKSTAYPKGQMFVDPQDNSFTHTFDLNRKTNFDILRIDNKPFESGLVDIIAKGSEKK